MACSAPAASSSWTRDGGEVTPRAAVDTVRHPQAALLLSDGGKTADNACMDADQNAANVDGVAATAVLQGPLRRRRLQLNAMCCARTSTAPRRVAGRRSSTVMPVLAPEVSRLRRRRRRHHDAQPARDGGGGGGGGGAAAASRCKVEDAMPDPDGGVRGAAVRTAVGFTVDDHAGPRQRALANLNSPHEARLAGVPSRAAFRRS